jgi:pyridoxine kinase
VLTGVFFDDLSLGAAAYDAQTNQTSYAFAPKIKGYYHGTGDVFGSALTASIINGKTLAQAIKTAVEFTSKSIERTYNAKTDIRYGVNFEEGLQDLE